MSENCPISGIRMGPYLGLAETLFIRRFVGWKGVTNHHRVGVASTHRRIGKVDRQSIAGFGYDGFDDATLPVRFAGHVKDGFVHAVIIAIAETPIRSARGPPQCPVE